VPSSDPELTREELIDVALVDVIGDDGLVPVEAVVHEMLRWCAEEETWTEGARVLLEPLPDRPELESRLEFLASLGMVRVRGPLIEVTRAGHQMWEGFPWEYVAVDDEGE
jgi:hypothetical protein